MSGRGWDKILAAVLLSASLAAAAADSTVSWGPLPAGWNAWQVQGQSSTPIASEGSHPLGAYQLVLQSAQPNGWRAVIEIRLSPKDIRDTDTFAAEFAGHGLQRQIESGDFNGQPALHARSAGRTSSFDDWLILRPMKGGQPWVATQLSCAFSPGRPGFEQCQARRAELEQILKTIDFGGSPPTRLHASILLPPDLKPGDVVSPSAVVVDSEGRPPRGEIGVVWYFNRTQTNGLIWDGQPLRIELQASAGGQALTAELTLPAYVSGRPVPAPPTAVVGDGAVPGLTGIGELPGPRDGTEALVGTLGPGALGLLGALLSGLLTAPGGPPPPRKPARPPKPKPRSRREAPTPDTPPDPEATGATAAEAPPAVPAHPERAGRARRAAAALKEASREAETANRRGRLFTDTLGRAGKDVVDATRSVGAAATAAARTLGHAAGGLREVSTDPKALEQALRAGVRGLTDSMRAGGRLAQSAAGAAADGLIAGQQAAARAYQNPGLLTSALGGAASQLWQKLSDPKVLWGALREFTGAGNFENALDPRRSLLQRFGEVGTGVAKLYGSVQAAAAIAGAARSAGARVLGQAGEGGAASAAARGSAVARPHAAAPGTVARPSRPPSPIPRPEAPYVPANVAPDVRGMPRASIRHVQMVADRHAAQIQLRPTNPDARRLLEQGAHPKPEFLKMKTISPDDVLLGAPRDGIGKVGYFKPSLPPRGSMSDEAWKRLQSRAAQRAAEFDDQAPKVAKLLKDGKIKVRADGTVAHPKTGRAFAGDHDLFDIRGANSERLPAAVRQSIQRELSKPPFNLKHPEHLDWDYSKLRRTLEPGETSSPYEIARKIDQKILDSHAPGGEALITVGSDRPLSASFYTGGPRS
jgi:hypothetical protein